MVYGAKSNTYFRTEMAFRVLSYKIKRMISLIGVRGLLAEVRHRYNTILHRWVLDNPNFKGFEESLSREQQFELPSLASTLNHYHRGSTKSCCDPILKVTRLMKDDRKPLHSMSHNGSKRKIAPSITESSPVQYCSLTDT